MRQMTCFDGAINKPFGVCIFGDSMLERLVSPKGIGIAIPLAMGILAPIDITLDPAIGAVFMSLSTVIVSINAQLLRGLDLTQANQPEAAASRSPRAA